MSHPAVYRVTLRKQPLAKTLTAMASRGALATEGEKARYNCGGAPQQHSSARTRIVKGNFNRD
jgi:hypothetical protein